MFLTTLLTLFIFLIPIKELFCFLLLFPLKAENTEFVFGDEMLLQGMIFFFFSPGDESMVDWRIVVDFANSVDFVVHSV